MNAKDVYNGDVFMEGDTLVAEDEGEADTRASPIPIPSSPPVRNYSISSHSSTSAEPEPINEIQSDTLISAESEEKEWEESLKPHQRAIGTQLTRVTKRVLRHIVDNETAIDDIVNTYANDGETLLEDLHARQEKQFDPVHRNIRKKKSFLKKEMDNVAERLRRDSKRLNASRPGA
jgi:hypothetical protein